jgi:hypothetical protein
MQSLSYEQLCELFRKGNKTISATIFRTLKKFTVPILHNVLYLTNKLIAFRPAKITNYLSIMTLPHLPIL